jgi:hypothetical protein
MSQEFCTRSEPEDLYLQMLFKKYVDNQKVQKDEHLLFILVLLKQTVPT